MIALRFMTTAVLLLLSASPAYSAVTTLTVYTYDSFTSDWGPGPKIKQLFEKRCACSLELVGLEDGVSILNRIRLEGRNSRADLVLGIDTNLTAEARATGLFEAHAIELGNSALPGPWRDPVFLPYDYGYFAFVYDRNRLAKPPASLRALVEDPSGPTLLIQDPRTSTPGLGLLLWIRKVYGEASSEAWAKLAPRIVTVSKGWSEAYGLFLKAEADMVLSYTTSPAYHIIAEHETRYAAARFAEGHYQQIEVAGLLQSSSNKALARDFLRFMISEEFQAVIPTTNWMYPAALPAGSLPAEFNGLVDPAPALLFDDEAVMRNRKAWIDDWLEVMSR